MARGSLFRIRTGLEHSDSVHTISQAILCQLRKWHDQNGRFTAFGFEIDLELRTQQVFRPEEKLG